MRRTSFPNQLDDDLRAIRDSSVDVAVNVPKSIKFGHTLLRDTREQTGWGFENIRAGAADGYARIEVETALASLDAADYTIRGFEEGVRVERKTAADLFQTLSRGRERFEAELEKLDRIEFSAVVIESDFSTLVNSPPTNMSVRSFVGSVAALSTRFKAKWFFCGNRRMAEGFAFRLFERWVRDRAGAKS